MKRIDGLINILSAIMFIIFILFLICVVFLMMNSCYTIKSKYELKDKQLKKMKSKRIESELIVKENRLKGRQVELKSIYISGAVISGDLKETDNNDELEFDVKKIKFMTSWHNGYTEGECTAAGKIIFKKKDGYYESMVSDNFEILDVTKGEIRYDIYYFKGKEGIKRFKNRLDRISETVDFLKTKKLKEFYRNARYKTEFGESFKKDAEVILFPELFGFKYLSKKNLLDKNFDFKDLDLSNDVVLSDEMVWRKSYTKDVFPESLQAVRNSGSMYKDFEEALDIFFVLYNLDYFFNNLLNKAQWIQKY